MKILIVDDEELLRKGLTKMIERMELPLVVSGVASDGLKALEMVKLQEPHVVLTDIRMPNMDGLVFIEKLSERHSYIRTIILSGYDDFDYAKKAIRLGCKDYLVKPPNFSEMCELLNSIYNEFSQEREKFIEESKTNKILHQNQLLLQTNFLRALITNKSKDSTEDITEQAKGFGIQLHSNDYSVGLLRCDNRFELDQKYSRSDWELLKYACWNIATEVMDGLPCFYDEQEHLVILLPSNSSFENHCSKLQEIRKNLSHYLNLSFSASLSSSYQLNSITEGYSEAQSLLSLRLLREKSVLITSQESITHTNDNIKPHLKQLKELQSLSSFQEMRKKLKDWVETVKNAVYAPEALLLLEQELRMELIVLIRKLPLKQGEKEGMANTSDWLEQLKSADSLSDYIKPALIILDQLCRQEQNKSHQNQSIEKAISYIQQHYNSSINLVSISEHVHMNSAYFSVMFKKKTGIGVIEYLTNLRMEKAKKLLAISELKTYQVAEAVGYHDPAYFSNIFKRHTGLTPQEYRNTKL